MLEAGSVIFVDTNVLLYSHDRKNIEKAGQAKSWLKALAKRRQATINLQVLNELTDVLLRRKWFETPEQVFTISAGFAELGNKPLTLGEVVDSPPPPPALPLLLVGLPAARLRHRTRLLAFPLRGFAGWATHRHLDDRRSFRP